MSLVICPNCQHEIKDTDPTCPNCGGAIEAVAGPLDPASTTLTERAGTIYVETKKKTNKAKWICMAIVVFGVLIIFLDRMYVQNSALFLTGVVIAFGAAIVLIVLRTIATVRVAKERFPSPKKKS